MLTEAAPAPGPELIARAKQLQEKISEGLYREVYRYDRYAIKVTKPQVTKRLLCRDVPIPTSWYTLVKFAIRDLNRYEYEQYRALISKIPADLHRCFATVHPPVTTHNVCYSINQLVLDEDGQISKTLQEHGQVSDPLFWQLIDELERQFIEKRICYLSLGGFNICVNRLANGQLVPVLVDYKRVGLRTFWHQLPLYLPHFLERKMRRRFQRLRNEFKL